MAGLDEFVASVRINRYEKGIHEADIGTAAKLADALGVPLSYFYAQERDEAILILAFASLSHSKRASLLNQIQPDGL